MRKETIDRILRFTADRDWDQFHTPANLAKSISIEANELLECFQWDDNQYSLDDVKDELADVIVYCIDLDEFPIFAAFDVVGVIVDLGFIACELIVVIRRNTSVASNFPFLLSSDWGGSKPADRRRYGGYFLTQLAPRSFLICFIFSLMAALRSGGYAFFNTSDILARCSSDQEYDPFIIEQINNLASSIASTKDRRIGTVLKARLPMGEIDLQFYAEDMNICGEVLFRRWKSSLNSRWRDIIWPGINLFILTACHTAFKCQNKIRLLRKEKSDLFCFFTWF